DGHTAILQSVKQELFRRHHEKQGQNGQPQPSPGVQRSSWQQVEHSPSSYSHPHPLTMSLSRADLLQEVGIYTSNREAPPLFISVTSEGGPVAAIASPFQPLSAPRPSYTSGTTLPKETDYIKHPTVFDELQSSLFPPGTLQSVVRSSMATPQEVVNDDATLFGRLNENENRGESGRLSTKAVASKIGLLKDHRLQKEFNVLVSVPPAVDPNISPQIYELPHDSRIDLVPCPKLRAQMILHQGKYDMEELFQLLVNKAICHGHPLDLSSWELPDEFFDRFGFLMGMDMERIRRKVWPRKPDGAV
ncbi:hypothetical protein BGZ98_000429, partial [Dissophora globulifera]